MVARQRAVRVNWLNSRYGYQSDWKLPSHHFWMWSLPLAVEHVVGTVSSGYAALSGIPNVDTGWSSLQEHIFVSTTRAIFYWWLVGFNCCRTPGHLRLIHHLQKLEVYDPWLQAEWGETIMVQVCFSGPRFQVCALNFVPISCHKYRNWICVCGVSFLDCFKACVAGTFCLRRPPPEGVWCSANSP